MSQILYLTATPEEYPHRGGRAQLYNVRTHVYYSPLTPDGKLDVGAAITVADDDVEELIAKSRYKSRAGEIRVAWTKSPSEAALRKQAWLEGVPYEGAAREEEVVMTPEVLKLQAAATLKDEDLVELLAQRGIQVAPAAAPPVAKVVNKQRGGRGPVPTPPVTVDPDPDEDE